MNDAVSNDERKKEEFVINKLALNNNPTPERKSYSYKTDRVKYDDISKRKAYKDKIYANKKTIKDPYTNKILYKNRKLAKKRFNNKNISLHTSQTDHTVPIKNVYMRNRDNVFLSNEDIKTIANITENYMETSANLNASKRDKSNIQTALDNNVSEEQKGKMINEQIKAEKAIAKKQWNLPLKMLIKLDVMQLKKVLL